MRNFFQKKAENKEAFSQEEFEKFHDGLGEGVIVELQEDKALIQFDSGEKLFGLKILYEHDLLEF